MIALTLGELLVADLVTDNLTSNSGLVRYLLVFVLAAIPWLEVLVVVPPAIGLGLNPLLVCVIAFLGNILPIYLIVSMHERLTAWWTSRRTDKGNTKRGERARRVLDRYGIVGLAVVAPVFTGVHLAAVIALMLGIPRRAVAVWMTAGVALWTIGLTIATTLGLSLL